MHFPRLAIVDLETTGADPTRDRITEIAILVTQGDSLIEQWSSLINPGMPIPERIQALIGITDAMVEDAPKFCEIADIVVEKLADTVFVAHNVRFDYNFLRAAYERESRHWTSPVMCSVKFSRALDPEFARHGLDALIERHGYHIESRHRALDDARIVWQFLQDARGRADTTRLQRAWDKAFSAQSGVPRLPRGDLEALPDSPGAWVYRSATGQVLDLGWARDLRSQVLGFFTAQRPSAKNKKMAAAVHDVDSWPCAGELGAQLKALELARNLMEQPDAGAFAWHWHTTPGAVPPILSLENLLATDPAHWQDLYGCLRGEREANVTLRELAKKHHLCASRIGLEQGGGPCQAVHLGRCAGVCIGQETTQTHDQRLMLALRSLLNKPWPFTGPIVITETLTSQSMSQSHVFDHWCYIGSASDETGLADLLATPAIRRFDTDIFRLLSRWLAVPENQVRLHTVPRHSAP
jgi:DNA polymerase-3 subunit epsilon